MSSHNLSVHTKFIRPTFYRIYKSKSTEGFQSVPYVVALFSAMLWIFYALVKSGEGLLITINAAGCVIETVYIVMYLVYAPRKAKVFTAKIILLLNIAASGSSSSSPSSPSTARDASSHSAGSALASPSASSLPHSASS